MANKEITTDQPETCWFIDLSWYQQNKRSFSTLAKNYLCPKCAKLLEIEKKEIPLDTLLSALKECCLHTTGFINERLPIMESIFRLFLANGNQPLDMEELRQQLYKWHGNDTYRTSVEILSRLLKKDEYYGIREAK